MLISTLSQFARRLSCPSFGNRAARRSRTELRREPPRVVTAAAIETLEQRDVPSALSIAQDALAGASGFLGSIQSSIESVNAGVSNVPLLGDDVNSSLHGLSNEIQLVRNEINSIANQLSNENIENEVKELLFGLLGPDGLDILGDSDSNNQLQANDVFVHLDEGIAIPSIEVSFDLHRNFVEMPLFQGSFATGLPGIPLEISGQGGIGIFAGFNYDNFHFKFDDTNGFRMIDDGANELTLFAEAGLIGGADGEPASFQATIGFLRGEVTDGAQVTTTLPDGSTITETKGSGLSLTLPVDITFGQNGSLGDFNFEVKTPYLSADLCLTIDVGFTTDTAGINQDFPGFKTDFVIHREFGDNPEDGLAPSGNAALLGESSYGVNSAIASPANSVEDTVIDIATAAFSNVQFKLGGFLDGVLKPVVDALKDILEPLQPVFDVINGDIPVLSDIDALKSLLNSDGENGVSLLDVANTASSAGLTGGYEGLIEVIKLVSTINGFIQTIEQNAEAGELVLNLGDFSLENTAGGSLMSLSAADNANTAGVEDTVLASGLDFTKAGEFDFAGLQSNLKTALVDDLGIDAGIADGLLGFMDPLSNGTQFSFPLFENPAKSIMQVFIGRDADLFRMEGKYDIDSEQLNNLPSFDFPIGLSGGLTGSLKLLADFKLGYDTFGLRQLISLPPEDLDDAGKFAEAIADGIYIGKESSLDLTVSLGAEVAASYVVVSAAVEGGFFAEAHFKVSDHQFDGLAIPLIPNVDGDPGKVRFFSELNRCLFDVHGDINAYLNASISVGVGPLSYTEHFDIAKETLFSFEGCIPNPAHAFDPSLGLVDNGELKLFIGADSSLRSIAPDDINEVFIVSGGADEGGGKQEITVRAYGQTQTFHGVTKITANANNGVDRIVIAKTVFVDAALVGGTGNDQLDYRGTGSATLIGGAGDDVLRGGNGAKNVLLGGVGNDSLIGGGLDATTTNIMGISVADGVQDDPDADMLQAGLGHNVMHGGSGNDRLYAGPLNEEVFGDAGNDTIEAGHGQGTLTGGAGDDMFVITSESGNTAVRGGSGADTVGIEGTTGVDTFNVASVGPLVIVGHATDDPVATRSISLADMESLLIDAGKSADTINVGYLNHESLQHVGLNLGEVLDLDNAVDHINVLGRSVADNVTIETERVIIQEETRLKGGITKLTGLPLYDVRVGNVQDQVRFEFLGGNDTINVKGVTGPSVIDGGSGNDVFNVTTKKISDFFGPAFLQTGAGTSTLNFVVDPLGEPESVTVTNSQIRSHWVADLPDPTPDLVVDQVVSYAATQGGNFNGGINVTTNGQDDFVFVRSTLAGTTTSINTAGGNDRITVSSSTLGVEPPEDARLGESSYGHLNDIAGKLKIDGGSGSNKLSLNDHSGAANSAVTVSSNQVLGLAGANNSTVVEYAAVGGSLELTVNGSNGTGTEAFTIQNPNAALLLLGNGGTDNVTVQSVSKPTFVLGGAGNDQFVIGNLGSLSFIQSPVGVAGGGGNDSLTLSDFAVPGVANYTLANNTVARNGSSSIAFDNDVELVKLNTGIGTDNVLVSEVPSNPAFVIDTGDGNDSITGPNGTNQWLINQPNSGTLNTTLKFVGTENLKGGSGTDTFAFSPVGQLTGQISDLGGVNDRLDYSARLQGVTVDLQTATATATAGVSGIEHVIGTNFNDSLFGNMNANLLDGRAGNDILLGREGNDTLLGGLGRDLIIGGLGSDAIFGGDGEDLLIGGRTTHDNNVTNLNLIRTEWSRNDLTYPQRINNLKAGIGPNQSVKLTTATYQDDAIADAFSGGDGLDWLWGLPVGAAAAKDNFLDLAVGEQVN